MDKLDQLLYKYMEKFGESFPTMLTQQLKQSELVQALENCLKSNKNYEVIGIKENSDY